MSELPFISIVIPTWNRPTELARLVGMINAEGVSSDLEIVVVDNASNEENWLGLKKIAEAHKNVHLIRNSTNIGMTPNWNKAIQNARGRWIGFMCDDDELRPEALSRVRKIIAEKKGTYLILQNSAIESEFEWIEPGAHAAKKIALPPASGQFWHREITEKLGFFDERVKYCPDAEFWMRLAYHYPVYMVRDYLVIPYQHDTNYMWVAFRSADFLQQVTLSIRLCSQYLLGEKSKDENLVQEMIDDGIWETMRTVLNNTFLRRGKMTHFPLYFGEFARLSVKLGRIRIFLKTVFNLPILRLKDSLRKFRK